MSDDEYGSFDDDEVATAIQLAEATPVRPRLQQRTIFGGLAEVQISPGAASYSTSRTRYRNRDEPETHHQLDIQALKTWVFPTNYAQRDYQFNIIRKALFTNVLVALPTGLGKTFIAAVVMYNWYRWAPKSKIVFLAPAKPLVTQQIDACYHVCGIPAGQTAELTGGIDKARRTAAYQERRVFFLTPQTFQNDLRNGLIDAKDISCLVVDEAHHATGNYAYVDVVRQMRVHTESFRILALTATPGKTVETVQEVIDALNISQIEIRSESSIDIRSYTHTKEIETILLDLPPEMVSIQTKYASLLRPMMQRLASLGVGMTQDPTKISAFGVREAVSKLQREARGGGRQSANAAFAIGGILASMAYNMELLNTHGIRPFYDAMVDLKSNVKSSENKKRIIRDTNFTQMMSEMESLTKDPAYAGHPKLDHLSGLLLNHFQRAQEEKNEQTRVMVFSSLRVSAEAIVRVLKQHSPLVKPTPFFGQQAGKTGSGMSQKEQQETISKFKQGIYNVIVATSVGEEGLDIGEIDMIICYDSSSSPARMLQRMGRTGRKRDGQVFVLCVRGKEEMAFIRAKDAHKTMQKKIEQGIDIKLADAVHRIVPWQINPECEKRLLEVPKDDKVSDRQLKTAARRRKEAKIFQMPEGVSTGFMSAGTLGKGRKSKVLISEALDVDKLLWDFECEQNSNLMSAAEEIELDRRFRKLDEDHEGCKIDQRAEDGVFLDVLEMKTITSPILLKHGRTTRMVKTLVLKNFKIKNLQHDISIFRETLATAEQIIDESDPEIRSSREVEDNTTYSRLMLSNEISDTSDVDSYRGLGSFVDDSDDSIPSLHKPKVRSTVSKQSRIVSRTASGEFDVFDDALDEYESTARHSSSVNLPSDPESDNLDYDEIHEKPTKLRMSQLARDSEDDDLPDTVTAIQLAANRKMLKRHRAGEKVSCHSHGRAEKGKIGLGRKRIKIIDEEEDE